MGFAEEMAQFDDQYKEAEAAAGGGLPLFTDGRHQAIINIARVEQGDYGWRLVIGVKGIDNNTKKPARLSKWTNLPPEDEEKLSYFKKDMELFQYEGLPSELAQACIDEFFIGMVCDIYVKTKPGQDRDYTNLYFDRVHEKQDIDDYMTSRGGGVSSTDDFATVAAGTAVLPDDDIPF